FMERSYLPCAKASPNPYSTSTDLCFARSSCASGGVLLPAVTLSFGAHGGQLVHDDGDTTNTVFHLQNDDGTVVKLLTGTTNGTVGSTSSATGEYFRVALPDGTVAYFGADKLPAEQNGGAIGTDTP